MVDVVGHESFELSLVPDDGPVEELSAKRADPALGQRAGPRCSGFAGDATPDEIEDAVGALRPVAREMSGVVLAQEVERALAGLVEGGPKRLSRSRRR